MTISDFAHLHEVNWHQSWTQNSSWVNWAQKRVKTVKFICVPFESKFKFLKDFSSNWRLPLVKVSGRSNNILESKDPTNSKKGQFHGCWIKTTNFLISQPYKVFLLAKYWGVSHRVQQDVNKLLVPISTI